MPVTDQEDYSNIIITRRRTDLFLRFRASHGHQRKRRLDSDVQQHCKYIPLDSAVIIDMQPDW